MPILDKIMYCVKMENKRLNDPIFQEKIIAFVLLNANQLNADYILDHLNRNQEIRLDALGSFLWKFNGCLLQHSTMKSSAQIRILLYQCLSLMTKDLPDIFCLECIGFLVRGLNSHHSQMFRDSISSTHFRQALIRGINSNSMYVVNISKSFIDLLISEVSLPNGLCEDGSNIISGVIFGSCTESKRKNALFFFFSVSNDFEVVQQLITTYLGSNSDVTGFKSELVQYLLQWIKKSAPDQFASLKSLLCSQLRDRETSNENLVSLILLYAQFLKGSNDLDIFFGEFEATILRLQSGCSSNNVETSIWLHHFDRIDYNLTPKIHLVAKLTKLFRSLCLAMCNNNLWCQVRR